MQASGMQKTGAYLLVVQLASLAACNGQADTDLADAGQEEPAKDQNTELATEQQAFWQTLAGHCGNAYAGRVADYTPHYADVAEVDRMVLHIRECSDELIHTSLHMDGDHSRNLLLTRVDGTLQLKHDHRNPDGSEEEITRYGGMAPRPGLPERQIFEADEHTAEILPERFDNFWFMHFMDEQTFAYGVHWPKHGPSIRLEFDLSKSVEEPPAPWGYAD